MSGVNDIVEKHTYGGLLGTIIKGQRELLGISRDSLAKNLVTAQTIKKLEKGECDSDLWLVTVLLQRLGVSVNRFEMILTSKEYEELLNVEEIEKELFEGKYEEAMKRIDGLERGTPVRNMLVFRLKAMAEFYIKKDLEKAREWLEKAIHELTPRFNPIKTGTEYVSVVELENLLAVEKVRFLEGKADSDWENRISQYMTFILKRSSDEDDTALLYAKCSWLYASRLLEQGKPSGAVSVANKALKRLTKRGFWNFVEPLLKVIDDAYSKKSNGTEKNFLTECYKSLSYLRKTVIRDERPIDRFLENSSYRNISLDYEMFKDTRISQGMTQEELADGIFESSKPISLMESGKGSVNRSNFGKLMNKLGVNRRRVDPMVLADSYEIIDLSHEADMEISRGDFEKGYRILKKIRTMIGKETFEKDNNLQSSLLITNYGLNFAPKDEILTRLKKLSEDAVDPDTLELKRIPFRNDCIKINILCLCLKDMGKKESANRLYRNALDKIKNSAVHLRHRSLDYTFLGENYLKIVQDDPELSREVLELLLKYGGGNLIPHAVNKYCSSAYQRGDKDAVIKLALSTYYSACLYNVPRIARDFETYLEKNGVSLCY
ncbi:MAG: hypothetical protein K6F63_03785 [Lachnospiraceae bacterium]|nr:hypothetical protein [Lachnospiraceae bacterium]